MFCGRNIYKVYMPDDTSNARDSYNQKSVGLTIFEVTID